jgi:uncharacterized protein YjeT (DUF2065 family)
MRAFLGDIFAFIVRRGEILLLIIIAFVFVEGLLYLFFPQKMKRAVEKSPLILFRIFGGLIIIFGVVALFLYVEILRPLFR